MAVGDGGGQYYEPTASQTNLRHEVWRGEMNTLTVAPNNLNPADCRTGAAGGTLAAGMCVKWACSTTRASYRHRQIPGIFTKPLLPGGQKAEFPYPPDYGKSTPRR